tara:strand:- start:1137 stop:1463 length:327 start_codon:yes stop_codon:yes gene_type:complete
MKLTTTRLKKLILNELKGIQEQEAVQQPDPNQQAQASEEERVKSTSELATMLLDLSNQVKAGKISNLDPTEINLINGIIGATVAIARDGSGSSILQRVYDVLEKQAEK